MDRALRGRMLRCLPLMLAALLFAGMFARITMLACLSGCSKQVSSLETALARLEKECSRQELVLSELHDLRRIGQRAAELGMKVPTEEQIRVLYIRLSTPESGATSAKSQP